MRCTLLNSLERHLAPLCRGLTSLDEPAKHQTRSLIWQRLWLMTPLRKWGRGDKGGEKKPSQSVFLFFFLSPLFCQEVGWSDPDLLIRPRRRRGCALTSAVDTRSHPVCHELATSFLRHLLFCPRTRVPQLRPPFVPEARMEPVVCVILLIHYGSALRGARAAFRVF